MNDMRQYLSCLFIFFLALVCTPAFSQETQPDVLRNLDTPGFENDRVRTFERTLAPSDEWIVRDPAQEYFVYVLEGEDLRLFHTNDSHTTTTSRAGNSFGFTAEKVQQSGRWKDEYYHKMENTGSGSVRLLIVEFKSSPPQASPKESE